VYRLGALTVERNGHRGQGTGPINRLIGPLNGYTVVAPGEGGGGVDLLICME
jgi:hypothetical protein